MQEFNVADLYGVLAADLADDARHWIRMAGPVERGAWIVDIDPLERSSEAIRVAFATLLPVRDDIEPGTLLVANSENRCIVLRFFEEFRIDAPQLPRSHAWWKAPGKLLAVDQPIWLRIGANE